MRLSSKDSALSQSVKQKRSTAKGYRLSGRKLVLLVIAAAVAGALLVLSGLPGYLKANLVLALHPEGTSALFVENDLAELHLDMKFKSFKKIEEKRQEALNGTLGWVRGGSMRRLMASDEDFVPAKMSFEGKSVDCKVRLKGDLKDHWEGPKWSLRVEMKKDGLVMGMSRFSLQDPATRNHTNEWLYLENLRMEGLIAPRYQFVNLIINGKPMGTYAMEESFSKELIESNKRREGVVVAFDEYLNWHMYWNIGRSNAYRAAKVDVRNLARVSRSETLKRQMETAIHLARGLQERSLSGEDVFNPERFGKFLALTHLWNAEHIFSWDDVNFYFDPITGKLEPVGREGDPRPNTVSPHCFFTGNELYFQDEMKDTWLNHALRSPRLTHAYIKHLELFTRPKYIAKISNHLKSKEHHLRLHLIKDLYLENKHEIWDGSRILLEYDPWKLLRERAHAIRLGLKEKNIVLAYARPSENYNGFGYEVIIRNALIQPIEVIGFEQGKKFWSAKDTLVLPSKENAVISKLEDNLVIPLRKSADDHPAGDHVFLLDGIISAPASETKEVTPESTLFVLVRILGLEDSPARLPVSMDHVRFEANLLPFLSQKKNPMTIHPFLGKEGKTYIIPNGDYNVTEDLVIPYGHELLINSGVTLRFASQATLISEGAIRAKGTLEAPVRLTAQGNYWGGVVVNNASSRSEWQHVHVSKTAGVGVGVHRKGIDRAGWTLTGGVTFYYSPASFVHCVFEQSDTEDALNVISSEFSILGCSFDNLASDAFDGDFVKGSIRDSVFTGIGGDAIDLSGSNVTIENIEARKVVDKAISAGENTWIELKNTRLEDIGFGVASKDLSEARIDEVQIIRARIAALAAYQKKETFGPAEISGKNLKVTETEKIHLVQTGSVVEIDGKTLPALPLNVEKLYAEEPSQP